jgi:dsDNA-binding SOS-regulon protein
LANTLLSTAESLSKSDDALAHLDEFRDLADRLEELIEQSLEQEDYKRADLLARQYRRIAQSGLTLNLQRAEASGALHLDRPGKLEKIILTDVSQAEALARLLEKSPNLSRQEIREALSIRKEHANRRRQTPAP